MAAPVGLLFVYRTTTLINDACSFRLTFWPGTEGIRLVVAVEIHVLQYLVDISAQALAKLAQALVGIRGEQLQQKLENDQGK